MGIVNFGINRPLVEKLAKTFELKNFIETGTYLGQTSYWASSIFKNVYTIELSEPVYQKTKKKYSHVKNIRFLFGDSKDVLPTIIPTIEGSSLFWLDGHWCGRDTAGKYNECPIFEELDQAIKIKDVIILIDDLRYFLGPNPYDHGENYPDVHRIIDLLIKSLPDHFITFHDDTLICAPYFCKKVIDEDWLNNYSKRFPITFKVIVSKMWWRIRRMDFKFGE